MVRRFSTWTRAVGWASLAASLVLIGSQGASAEDGITVSGTGEVLARPDHLEIDVSAGAAAELTSDAIVKYRDAVRRTMQAFEKLKLKNLEVRQLGLGIASGSGMGAAGGMPGGVFVNDGNPTAAKPQMNINRSLRLVLSEIQELPEDELVETVSKLLDTAQDVGASVGPSSSNPTLAAMMGQVQQASPVVTFVVEEADELREKAYQQAFAQATARAQRLAKLAKATLGPALAIEELADAKTSDESPQASMIAMIYGNLTATTPDSRLTSEKLKDIPIRVTLRVRFSIKHRGRNSPDQGSPPDDEPAKGDQ